MIRADLAEDGESIVLKSDYPFRDRPRFKRVPGSRFKKGEWLIPLSWPACKALRTEFGDELVVEQPLAEWSQEYFRDVITPAMELRDALELPPGHPDRDLGTSGLFGYQQAGVAFLEAAERSWLCDEMGLGKTRQIIEVLRRTGDEALPALIVVPASLKYNWAREFEKWWPDGPTPVVLDGSANERRRQLDEQPEILIMNYEQVRTHSRLAPYGSIKLRVCTDCDPNQPDHHKPAGCEVHPRELNQRVWKTIVVDEAHRLKDPKAKQTRAIWAVHTEETSRVHLLSGTPLANNPADLWTGLHMLDPKTFTSRTGFIDRYCETETNPFSPTPAVIGITRDPVRRAEFFEIIEPMLRRTLKAQVLKELPPKVYETREAPMTPVQAKQYKAMKKKMLAEMADGSTLAALDGLALSNRLLALAAATGEHVEVDEETGSSKLTLAMPSNKVAALLELIGDLPEGEPLVVFAVSRQVIELAATALEKAGITFSKLVGGMSAIERDLAVSTFQSGQRQVFLTTISAGGTGITLTRASIAVFLQRTWSAVEDQQAEARVHRIGSEVHSRVLIIDFITPDSIESKVAEVLLAKGERLEEVVRDRAKLRGLIQ